MPTQPLTPHRVLVIDDDATMRDLLAIVLGAEGHTILTADSGHSALDLLSTLQPAEHPTIILTDLQMPGLTGARLATSLRAAAPQAKLIAMSGAKPAAAKLKPHDAFLQKPFTAADFNATASPPSPNSATKSPTPTEPLLPAPCSLLPALDEEIYTKLTATMPPAQLNQLYTMCLADAETRLARMKQAAASADAATFSKEAHAIKGGCGMLGARQLHDLASRMEKGALLCTSLLNDFPPAAERLRRILDART